MKHVHAYVAKGKTYRYFRHGKVKVRLHGEPGSPEFQAEYDELLAGLEIKRENAAPGTIAALIADFKRSPEFQKLAAATRAQYAKDLDRLGYVGHARIKDLTRMHVLKMRDALADKPRKADHFVQVARRLLSWAVDRGYADANPLLRVSMINEAEAHLVWSDDECRRFEESGPREALLTPYMLGLFTGQRRGDVLLMARNRYDGEAIEVIQGKTGAALWIPCHARLKAYLDGLPTDRLLFCLDGKGLPWKDGSTFSHEFGKHLDKIGLGHLCFHGLRHTAATALADAGCSDRDIAAITGHKTPSMVRRYTARADQRRRASAAITKLQARG